MKREKVYCLILAAITTIVILGLMINFVPIVQTELLIVMILGYFTLTFVVLVSSLDIKKGKKSKEDWVSLLVGLDGIVVITSFIIGNYGNTSETMKSILLITFSISFVLLAILCGIWSKFEKDK